MVGPLDGIRVIDLSSVIMGPLAAQYLGDMGADVIKVEGPEGDLTRAIGPRRSDGMGAVFMTCNRNKRSVVLDLKDETARRALERIVGTADVVIHSVRSAAAERIGLSYPALSALKPDLIYCHVKGFADGGAYAGQPAFDDTIQALSGLADLQRAVSPEPRYVPSSIADKTCALHAAYAITLALFHRQRTGRGQEVSLPMFETMVAFNTAEHLWGYAFEPPIASMGYESVRRGTRRPFRTRDGHLAFLPYSDLHWRKFFLLIGRRDLAEDPRFKLFDARMKNYTALFAIVEQALAGKTTDEWIVLLSEQDIPMSRVNTLEDLAEDEHLASVDFWRFFDHPSEGRIRLPSIPLDLTGSPPAIRRLPPQLGEHTAEILAEVGCSLDDTQRLIRRGTGDTVSGEQAA